MPGSGILELDSGAPCPPAPLELAVLQRVERDGKRDPQVGDRRPPRPGLQLEHVPVAERPEYALVPADLVPPRA